MIRKDIHRPSAITPSEYEFVGLEYIKIDSGDILANCAVLQAERAAIQAHMASTGGSYSTHEHGGNCHICGASCVYTVLFYHANTNTYIRTGMDCAQKLEMSQDETRFNRFRAAIEDVRLALAGKKKALATLMDAGLATAWDIYNTPYEQLPKDANGYVPYEEETVRDIVGKLVQYGSVSDKQIGYLRKLIAKIDDRAAEAARRAAENANAADCPSGKVTVKGTVLSTKIQDGFYGNTLKMLVKDDSGFKVWGTVPASISVNRDDRVTFTATVEPSKDDPKFGFYKRPTQASVEAAPVYEPTIIVSCPTCGVDYDEKSVKVLNVEEGLQGEDILTFTCPEGHETKSCRRG
jgi:hypothetical protein